MIIVKERLTVVAVSIYKSLIKYLYSHVPFNKGDTFGEMQH